MSEYSEQKAVLQDRIAKVNADIANDSGVYSNLDLNNRLKDAQKKLADLEEHHAVMNGPLNTVLKNNGLDDNLPNNSAFVDERLVEEMVKAANAHDMDTYKHLRNQRKALKAKASKGPGGVLIGNNPHNVSQ